MIDGWATGRFQFGQESNIKVVKTETPKGGFGKSNEVVFGSYYRQLKYENENLRKPCLTCGNLVLPKEQSRHDDVYHLKLYHTPEMLIAEQNRVENGGVGTKEEITSNTDHPARKKTRNKKFYLYNGQERTIRELSEMSGISISTLNGRILDRKISVEDAIAQGDRRRRSGPRSRVNCLS